MKVGGSVLTYKRRGLVKLRRNYLRRLIPLLPKDTVLVHGAGSYSIPALKYRDEPVLFYSVLKRMQMKLVNDILEVVSGVRPVFYVDSGSIGLENMGVVKSLREMGFLPLTGAAVTTEPSILSGDDVALYLGKVLGEEVVFLTDVPGVLDKQGELIPVLEDPRDVIDLGKRGYDPSGGMAEKVRKVFSYGVRAYVLNGFDFKNLRKFFEGEEFAGTVINGKRGGVTSGT